MKTLSTVSLTLFSSVLFAQSGINLKDESFLKKELEKTRYEIDSDAKAIILFEEGSVYFEDDHYDYKYEIVAKLLSDEAIEHLAEVTIPRRENMVITGISAESFNLNGGKIERTKLESDNILKDKIDDKLKVIKFNIPGVKKGSIIHYSYKFHKSSAVSVPEWPFQNLYPTLYSKYSVRLPGTFSCNSILRSGKVFKEASKEKELETCDACQFTEKYESTGSYMAWATKNIPAFVKEPFSSGKDNFMERIKVMITSVYLSNGSKYKLFNNWTDFSKKFLYDNKEYIGQVFSPNNFLDDKVNEITKSAASDIEKAKSICNYVKLHFSMVHNDDDNIKSVFRNGKGDVFGINMLMIAMMKKAGLDCDPVVLSTKSNERLSSLYPSPYDLNYLVGYFKDGNNKTYLLDATAYNLPFGTLKPECYNGYARIVNETGDAINLSPDEIKDKTTTLVSIKPVENNSLSAKVDVKLGIFKSMDMRKDAKGDSTDAKNKLIQSLAESMISVTPGTLSIKNFNNPDEPITMHYEGVIKLDTAVSTFYITPYLSKFYTKNPFTAIERNLPVELDYNEDQTLIYNFQLPENYSIDDFPKSYSIKFDNNMSFSNTYNYDVEKKTLTMASKFQTTATTYPAIEYKNIRAVFEKMVEEQNKKFVLKRSHI
ncbi:DUF3857 domain-containing protein [Taibaiella lutea]|uniref:DUF3857 domain-containing protein n=1 Tax=Taibaiella lutea TaxID=2608001 RepID=A0A5M6CRW1_9BACT|nr:DUF3857 domain-containing protein [Taibaiella lutea]KAA5536702.1 DUF3857 domain-containing protein [Taibaiella lutea]